MDAALAAASNLTTMTNLSAVCARIDSVATTDIPSDELLASSLLLAAAVLTSVAGARLLRPISALVGAVAGFWLGFYVVAQGADCDARLVIAGGMGVGCAALAVCVLQFAILIMGALVGGVFAHQIFLVWPSLETLVPSSELVGRSLFYWGIVMGTALVCGVAARCYGHKTLVLLTSAVGGAGVAYVMESLRTDQWWVWVSLGTGVLVGTGGYVVQRRGCRRAAPMK